MNLDWFTWACIAALCWGVQPIMDKFGVSSFNNPLAAMSIRCLGATVGAIVFLPFLMTAIHANKPPIPKLAYLALFGAGLFGSVLGSVAYLHALKLGDVGKVPFVTSAWPVISFFLSVLLYGETLSLRKILAIIFVITGVILLKA